MEADLATPAQVRYISALMHRKAEEENRDYTEIRDEIKERYGFKNYSKLSRGEISELIGELEGNDGYDNGGIETDARDNGSDDNNNNNNGKVGEYVEMYADIWKEITGNETFINLSPKEQSIAAAGIFREIVKDQRTERIAELRGT